MLCPYTGWGGVPPPSGGQHRAANVLARWKGRERPVAFAVLCLLIASGLTTSQPETSLAQTGGKPNILFILTDDMRPDDLRFMPKTQNLLADQGLRPRMHS